MSSSATTLHFYNILWEIRNYMQGQEYCNHGEFQLSSYKLGKPCGMRYSRKLTDYRQKATQTKVYHFNKANFELVKIDRAGEMEGMIAEVQWNRFEVIMKDMQDKCIPNMKKTRFNKQLSRWLNRSIQKKKEIKEKR